MKNTSIKKTELALVDANVLVYAHDQQAEHHARCYALLVKAERDVAAALCVTSQVLAEFFSVVTNPKRVAKPRPAAEARAEIETLLALPGVNLLLPPMDLVTRWLALTQSQPVIGSKIFDLQLVAAMQGNGVSRIYTYNRKDFEQIPGIEVLTP